MVRYALIQNSDKSILEYKDYPDDFDKTTVSHKYDSSLEFDLLPVEYGLKPNYDPLVEEIQEKTPVVMVKKVKIDYEKVALPAETVNKNYEDDAVNTAFGSNENFEYFMLKLARLVDLMGNEARTAGEETEYQALLAKVRTFTSTYTTTEGNKI